MDHCVVAGCSTSVSKPGHKLCLHHWRADREGAIRECDRCRTVFEGAACPKCAPASRAPDARAADGEWFSSTRIGEALGLSSRKVNLLLSELGWIERYVKGWVPTTQGLARGAVRREVRQTGVPYVIWPASIVENRVLLASIRELSGPTAADEARSASVPPPLPAVTSGVGVPAPASDPGTDFRARFPAPLRTQDGHFVRSRAEVMIDNWLYTQGIVHAYERRLPLDDDETVYCDFYLPQKRVYVEYWGMEKDPKYAERKDKKIAVYAKHGFQLVELTDQDIANLDEALPRKLLKYGVECD
ncbi:MAG: hypothetical protein HMLKMBBP_01357 [Planctomycetes bacterium]|nr:hypothetical protein [Planctomycetota bacterium]